MEQTDFANSPLLSLALPWKPTVKERPRFVRATGRAYTPAKTLKAEAALLTEFQALQPDWEPYDQPCAVEYTFTNSHVGVVLRAHEPYTQRQCRGDVDNHVKLISDALNGVMFTDDRLVVSSLGVKL
jgi:Holliday junction resolvase RusA-like endonuclease